MATGATGLLGRAYHDGEVVFHQGDRGDCMYVVLGGEVEVIRPAGTLDVVASDHAPYRLNDAQGKRVHGTDAPFTSIPNGMPGFELRLPLLFSEGVVKGRLTACQFVGLTSSTPARLYGMFPQKGALAIGSDADLVVWDADREAVVSQAALHDAMDYTPFEGMSVTGWPSCTISRGEVVWDGQTVQGDAGRGRFIQRAPLGVWRNFESRPR